MLGNIAIGLSVLAPAGMLAPLARDLGVDIRDTGLLVTYGALVLCISSPVAMTWPMFVEKIEYHRLIDPNNRET